jgi:hypothetical protein
MTASPQMGFRVPRRSMRGLAMVEATCAIRSYAAKVDLPTVG